MLRLRCAALSRNDAVGDWVAHAPRVLFSAPRRKSVSRGDAPDGESLGAAGPLPGGGAGHSTRGACATHFSSCNRIVPAQDDSGLFVGRDAARHTGLRAAQMTWFRVSSTEKFLTTDYTDCTDGSRQDDADSS